MKQIGALLLFVVFCSGFLAGGPTALAQIPKTISYQGLLTDAGGNPVTDGNYSLTFKLYAAATGGSALWSEAQTAATTNGIFNVILGSSTPIELPFDNTYYLGMTVGAGSEMTPRVQLTASPYSLRSVRSDTAGLVKVDFGATGSLSSGTPLGNGPGWIFHAPNGERRDFLVGDGGTVIDYSLYVNSDGNVGVGTGSWPGGKLGVDGDIYMSGNLTKSYTPGTRNNASPLAFGTINSNATVASATPNVSASWNSSSSLYEITISGESYSVGDYVTVVSALGSGTAAVGSGGGKLYVFVRNSSGTLSQIGFSFVTYKP